MKIKVMIDTNVLIYFLLGDNLKGFEKKEQIKNLFNNKSYQFVITTRIIDETIFKLMVINSGKKLKQLKKDKNLLVQQIFIFKILKDFLKDFNFKIYEIQEKHYWKLPNIIQECGLLGNDALTALIMKENNLKYIATLDSDFNNCCFIKNILS